MKAEPILGKTIKSKNLVVTFGKVRTEVDNFPQETALTNTYARLALTESGVRLLQTLVLSYHFGGGPEHRQVTFKVGELLILGELSADLPEEDLKLLSEIIDNLPKQQLSQMLETLWFEAEVYIASVKFAS